MIQWNKINKEDLIIIDKITKRAAKTITDLNVMNTNMDITAVHIDSPLRLEDFLNAPDMDFVHDVVGIHNNLNRQTGKLENCFLPRYTK